MPTQTSFIPGQRAHELPPELPIPAPPERGGLTFVSRAQLTQQDAQGVTLTATLTEGERATVRLAVVSPGVLRVLLYEGTEEPERVSLARDPGWSGSAKIEQSGNALDISGPGIRAKACLDPFRVEVRDRSERLLLCNNQTEYSVSDELRVSPFGWTTVDGQRVGYHDSFAAAPDEHYVGFGEKFGSFDKRGQRLELWNYDAHGVSSERAYKNVPFFVSSRGYGIFVDTIQPLVIDAAASNSAICGLAVPDRALDYYVIAGPTPAEILARYATLVGTPALPPKWAFGLWVSSSFTNDSSQATRERAQNLRKQDIPADVIHLDCFWQRWGHWSDMNWDLDSFPDPEELVRELRTDGWHVCLWINSYFGHESQRFREAAERGYLLRTPAGEPYVIQAWGLHHPPVGLLDVTNPEAVTWFQDLLRPLLRMGVEVFKTDFGEAVPADAVAYNGMTGDQLHNYYTLLYNDAVAEVTRQEGAPGFVWGRSTWAGGQRHSVQWGGDPNASWADMAATLRGGLGFNMSGHPFWSHDIGGFRGTPSPKLYARWAQFGLLSPLARMHGTTTRLPWEFGEETLEIVRYYTKLRYRLLPYLYSTAIDCARTGHPMLRPVAFDYPHDPAAWSADLEYVLGSALLVAPMVSEDDERDVYIPAGQWADFHTGEVVTGPVHRRVWAPLHICPLWQRVDALLPETEVAFPQPDRPFDNITVAGYISSHASFDLHDDDGTTSIDVRRQSSELRLTVDGPKTLSVLNLSSVAGAEPVTTVILNGISLPQGAPGAPGTWAATPEGGASITMSGPGGKRVEPAAGR
ncbi:MAG: alpha-xylosidase [Actinobacteria bacterium]|nr:alpha-xylosidase [Actinomycetota bacterium]